MIPALLLQVPVPIPDPNNRIIAWATVVMAVVAVVSLVTTILLWLTTRKSVEITKRAFEVAQRPYIGTLTLKRADEEDRIRFLVNYVNGGTVAAHDVQSSITLITDGLIMPTIEREETPTVFLLPNRPQTMVGLVHEPSELSRVNNASTISLVFKCDYKGVDDKRYSYEERFTYDKMEGAFLPVKAVAT